MLSTDDRANIMLWVKRYFAEATKTRTTELIKGIECKRNCDQIVKVFMLKRLIERFEQLVEDGHDIEDVVIDNLYRRITCLIRLKTS